MIVFLSTADTELLTVDAVAEEVGVPISAANPADLDEGFLTEVLPKAQLVAMRLHGGRRAFPWFDAVVRACRERAIPCLAWPGDLEPDLELDAATTVPREVAAQAFAYLLHGGRRNARNLFRYLAVACLGCALDHEAPVPEPRHGIYRPEADAPLDLPAFQERFPAEGRPTVGVVFYRAHYLSGNTGFVDDLVRAIEAEGGRALPVFCHSLKPEEGASLPEALREHLLTAEGAAVDVLVSTLSFSVSRSERERGRLLEGFLADAFVRLGVPVLQAVVSTGTEAAWEGSRQGLGPVDVAMSVAMPEFDGRIVGVPVSFKAEEVGPSGRRRRRYRARADRVALTARLALRLAALRRKPNAEKRIAFLLTNYPSRDSRLGNAVGLDTPASLVAVLRAMAARGYRVGPIPEDGDALVAALVARATNDEEGLTEAKLRSAERLPGERYRRLFAAEVAAEAQAAMVAAWGEPPGDRLTFEGDVVVPGLLLDHVFVGVQPPRGFGDDPVAVYHSPDLVPTHQYVGYYRWLRDVFGADAVVHVGKHGTLEWLPGKGIGLSRACFPEVVLQELPNFYPYIVNNPGEGTQAKRRSHAVIVDHMIPPMTTADTYDALRELEDLLDQYAQVQALDPTKLPWLREAIWATVRKAELDRDLGAAGPPPEQGFDDFLARVDGYLCELKAAQIRGGLHVLGRLPETDEAWADLLLMLTRLPNGDVPSVAQALGEALGLDPADLGGPPGAPYPRPVPEALLPFLASAGRRSVGDVGLALEGLARVLFTDLRRGGRAAALGRLPPGGGAREGLERLLGYVEATLIPKLLETTQEIDRLLDGLEGRFVPPGPSGAPTRGMADILPTGRNFYAVDPQAIPSPAAWEVGKALAEELLARYVREEGRHPESVAVVVWGTAAMRTQGDDIAEVLALLGVEPVWRPENRRVVGLRPIPLERLGRPRVDVTVRVSGFFRDAFPHVLALLDRAVRLVAELPEPPERNFVRRHRDEEVAEKLRQGVDAATAEETSLFRVFGAKPGAYGSGVLPLLESGAWRDADDIARVYLTWSGYAYTERHHGLPAAAELRYRLARVDVATKNQDNREHDIFDSDDYYQDHGGLIATIRALSGRDPKKYFGDSHRPDRVVVRDLVEEARRVFRTRVVNPKWLTAMERHGYKGAMELAATVDYLFGYDATAGVVEDWMYRQLAETYLGGGPTRRFLEERNPWALKDIAQRLLEAAERGLWEEPPPELLETIRQALLEAEASLEGREGTS